MSKTIRVTRQLWDEYAERARRENLVLEHANLVEKIARQVHRTMTHVDLEDLQQSGFVGLLEAAARYQPSAGVFEHYAYFRVRGAMIDAHRRSAYRDDTLFLNSIDEIHHRLGYVPAYVTTDNGPLPDEVAARREQAQLLADAVAELSPEERVVFCGALAGTPLAETAAACGRSVAWARAKLASARAQLGARVIMWGLGLDKIA
jgi:RNA polymerase sigma factor (sigma-70 family)